MCKQLDFDPFRCMVMIAQNLEHPVKVRALCAIEIARYLAPYYKDTDAARSVPPDNSGVTNVFVSVDDRLAQWQALKAKRDGATVPTIEGSADPTT